jgi:hypothetical protein
MIGKWHVAMDRKHTVFLFWEVMWKLATMLYSKNTHNFELPKIQLLNFCWPEELASLIVISNQTLLCRYSCDYICTKFTVYPTLFLELMLCFWGKLPSEIISITIKYIWPTSLLSLKPGNYAWNKNILVLMFYEYTTFELCHISKCHLISGCAVILCDDCSEYEIYC